MTTAPRWRISVDGFLCRGSGVCEYEAPDRFRVDPAGTSSPTIEIVEPDPAVRRAAEFCPVSAILVRDAATGTVVAPSEGPAHVV